jgi:hypothetical protein
MVAGFLATVTAPFFCAGQEGDSLSRKALLWMTANGGLGKRIVETPRPSQNRGEEWAPGEATAKAPTLPEAEEWITLKSEARFGDGLC